MRPVEQLIDTVDPAWPAVEALIASAPHPVEVLPADPARSRDTLYRSEVTTRSYLGAVIFHTGGILVDHGWLRILGSGHAGRGLADFATANPATGPGVLVAVDVLGGQFAWAPAGGGTQPTVHYFAPDSLEWEDTEMGYQQWLTWALQGDLEGFYGDLRWPGWPEEVAACRLDQGIHTWPPLATAEGKDVATVSRKPIRLSELVNYLAGTTWALG